jgi:hypothetical protein
VTGTRFWDGGRLRRIAVVDAFEFSSGVRMRFAGRHRGLGIDDIRTVEAATRQWFRLNARHPRAKLSMPSVVVDDLWLELVRQDREYATFCRAAFGRLLHHGPESAVRSPAPPNRTAALVATFHLARRDEGCGGQRLPLLFRVDKELAVDGGRHYLADCGGRGQCYELHGTWCLQHLQGVGKRPRGGPNRGGDPYAGMAPSPAGFGDGIGVAGYADYTPPG